MAKFYGTIGYVQNEEIRPGVYKEQVTERKYSGDLMDNIRQLQSSDKVNDDINISNKITPVSIDDAKTTTKITIDSTVFHGAEMMNAFRAIEDALYGTDKTEAWLPVFSELEELIYYHRCLIDSKSEALLDSSGKPLLSRIYE